MKTGSWIDQRAPFYVQLVSAHQAAAACSQQTCTCSQWYLMSWHTQHQYGTCKMWWNIWHGGDWKLPRLPISGYGSDHHANPMRDYIFKMLPKVLSFCQVRGIKWQRMAVSHNFQCFWIFGNYRDKAALLQGNIHCPSVNFHWHRNIWSWMTLNGHFKIQTSAVRIVVFHFESNRIE